MSAVYEAFVAGWQAHRFAPHMALETVWGIHERTALAGEAGTAETTQIGSVHEHATAKPERPNTAPILPKKERPL